MYISVQNKRIAPSQLILGKGFPKRAQKLMGGTHVVVRGGELRPGYLPNGLPISIRKPRFLNKNRNNIRLVI